jgi:hypothetical protein
VTPKQSLEAAAAIIRASVPDLRTLLNFLEDGGQKRLAAEIRRQNANPTVRIHGQAHIDLALWLRGALK